MKKKYYIVLILTLFLLPLKVFASGGFSVSSSSINMYPGETKIITINSDNAVGKLNISSANSEVAYINIGSVFIQTPGSSQTITITSQSVGTTTISVVASENFATMDEEILSGQTTKITVNVIEKPVSKPEPKPVNPTPTKPQKELSKNNNLKNISVEGYDLIKVDNNNYTLTVSNDITNINISAFAEDSKAKVSGIGSKELQVGENNIVVIITSESGVQNKINVKVTRKDGYYLEDLNFILNNEEIYDADIIINDDSKLSKEDISKIKESKKIFRLNYYDENKKLIYSWIINGRNIKDINGFSTFIAYTTDNVKEIYKLSNYADGMYIKFEHNGDLPQGIKIKLYVGEKFDDDSIVNLYHFNKIEKLLEIVKDGLIVKNGYIEFELGYSSEYFVTMSTISNVETGTSNLQDIFLISTVLAIIIIIGLVVFIIIKFNPSKKINIFNEEENILINSSSNISKENINKETTLNVNNYSNINNSGNLFDNNLNKTQLKDNNNNSTGFK